MPHLRTTFHQLLEPLDRRIIARAVAAHAGDHGVGSGERSWTCERHLKSLLFAQWAGLTSLREIVAGLGAHRPRFYHLNLRAPCRSTLAEANADRPAAVFRDIAMALIPVAAGALRRDSEALIRLLDATPIPLKGDGFPWAEANSRTRGLKVHLLYDPRQRRPVWFDVTSAKVDDVVAGRGIPLEPGATPAFAGAGSTSSTRAIPISAGGPKSSAPAPSSSRDASATRGAARSSNRRSRATASWPTAGSRSAIASRAAARRSNPLYQVELREIAVARPDDKEPLYLLTNDLQRPAGDSARLYKERWDPGLRRGGPLLFKWLKQNLKIRRFLGRSENAVRTQIYVALIAFMLLRILHHTAARAFKKSTALLLTHLKLGLFGPFSLCQANTPPPQSPALRLPNPQSRFAFQ